MKIVFIGAGNVAGHLATALHNKGIEIIQIFSRTKESAESLAHKVNAAYITDITELNKNADVYIYSVNDSILPRLISKIEVPQALHIHTSGSTSTDVFKNTMINYGVLYPLQTFSREKTIDFSSVPFFIEASNESSLDTINEIASLLSPELYVMNSDNRRKLHLSAVFVCNFVNHMYEIGSELVNDAGVEFNVLKPLIKETTEKIRTLNPYEAQTGPAVRNDETTIDKHLKLLKGKRNLETIYKLISEDIHSVHNKEE